MSEQDEHQQEPQDETPHVVVQAGLASASGVPDQPPPDPQAELLARVSAAAGELRDRPIVPPAGDDGEED